MMDINDLITQSQKLISAVKQGNQQELETLLNCKSFSASKIAYRNPNLFNNTPYCLLTLAALQNHDQMVPQLMAAGLSKEGHSECSVTPLIVAANCGHVQVVRELLRAGADPLAKVKNDLGSTALHLAALNGRSDCVSELLPVTTLNVTDNLGYGPVHTASIRGHTAVLRLLHKANWKIQALDKSGRSALHHTAAQGFLEAVKFLVDAGLSPTLKDHDGYTAVELSRLCGSHEIDGWLLKHCGREVAANTRPYRDLMKEYADTTKKWFLKCISDMNQNQLGWIVANVPNLMDSHMRNEEGVTLLHAAAANGNWNAIMVLTEHCGLHHHVLTYHNHTPADIAQFNGRQTALQVLHNHQCSKGENLPYKNVKELYEKLLTVIVEGDDVTQASKLLCAGAPLESVGSDTVDALPLAVRSGRSGLVSLLLAAGAPLTSIFQGCNLLELAWTSANLTPKILCFITNTVCEVLQLESRCADMDLNQGINYLITTIRGEYPWNASWLPEESELHLSKLLWKAAKANCPLTASFLRKAGASPFLKSPCFGTTALHEAIKEKHCHMTDTLVRDLGACIYLPDDHRNLPTDLMSPQQREQLEMKMYEKERRKLQDLKYKCTSQTQIKIIVGVLCLQQLLYKHPPRKQKEGLQKLKCYIQEAVQLATRLGLQQLTWLLIHDAGVAVDDVKEPVTGATALHLAAAHGQAGCVALLLADGADPSKWDRYGHTAAHLAAMFGHNTTTQLLTQHSPPDTSRAGATVTQVQQNFQQYLRCYKEDGQRNLSGNITHEGQDQDVATFRILDTIKVEELVKKAEQVKVRFEGEAETVRSIVLREIKTLVEQVGQRNPIYQGQLVLVGSSSDGTKINAPDEFDINLVLDHPPPVQVTVTENSPDSFYKGKLRIQVETEESALQENSLMNNLYDVMKDVLSEQTLKDGRLSLVPPGLTRTQVGVALSLAWQGSDYPLLLVGVDLVPVVEVEWHPQVKKPPLTPPNSTTMYLSNMEDGSWRCSFAHTEAKVLNELSEQEGRVYLVAKTMVSSLKAEPWMPTDIKAFYTWWCDRRYKIPLLTGFCLKNSFLRLLEKKRENDTNWMIEHTIDRVIQVFREMCTQPDGLTDNLYFGHSPAYFGGDFEGPKPGYGAPHIISYLDFHLNQGPKKIRSEQFSSKTH